MGVVFEISSWAGVVVKRTVPIVVVEPRTLLREGVMALLHGTAYRIVFSGCAVSDLPGPRLAPEPPQLAVLGLSGNLQENAASIRKLRELWPECKVVALGDRAGLFELKDILNCGFDGILFNVASAEALLKVFDLVLLGQHVVIFDRGQFGQSSQVVIEGPELSPVSAHNGGNRDPEAVSAAADSALPVNGGPKPVHPAAVHLSNRERQILACVARGDANKLIAHSCSITEATVKAHLKAILRKISVRNRTQAALWAIDHSIDINLQSPLHRKEHGNGAAAT